MTIYYLLHKLFQAQKHLWAPEGSLVSSILVWGLKPFRVCKRLEIINYTTDMHWKFWKVQIWKYFYLPIVWIFFVNDSKLNKKQCYKGVLKMQLNTEILVLWLFELHSICTRQNRAVSYKLKLFTIKKKLMIYQHFQTRKWPWSTPVKYISPVLSLFLRRFRFFRPP